MLGLKLIQVVKGVPGGQELHYSPNGFNITILLFNFFEESLKNLHFFLMQFFLFLNIENVKSFLLVHKDLFIL